MSNRPKVMVVDDDPLVRQMLINFLQREDYEVSSSANGQEALDQLAQAAPDIILLDMNMPVMGGLELLPEVKKINKGIKIIMMTGLEIDQARTARELGASAFLIKPFSLERLKELIEPGR